MIVKLIIEIIKTDVFLLIESTYKALVSANNPIPSIDTNMKQTIACFNLYDFDSEYYLTNGYIIQFISGGNNHTDESNNPGVSNLRNNGEIKTISIANPYSTAKLMTINANIYDYDKYCILFFFIPTIGFDGFELNFPPNLQFFISVTSLLFERSISLY